LGFNITLSRHTYCFILLYDFLTGQEKKEIHMVDTKPRTAFIYSTQLEKYRYPPSFPLVMKRAGQTYSLLLSTGLLTGDNIRTIAPKPATRTEIMKFHSANYLDVLVLAAEGKVTADGFRMGLGTLDCPVFGDMYDYSALACGATLTGAELILSGEADIAFNPSGGFHHAKAEQASGFCYLNDMVLGCIRLVEKGKRVLYLDLDAHHGDGVQEAFYDKKEVLVISLHESGETLFPWTGFIDQIGKGQGLGFNVNVPLPIGIDDKAYLNVFNTIVIPLIKAYAPDVIVLELGMDALAGDPLAHLSLTNNAFAEITSRLMRFNKPILATGGGGYNVEKTVRGWALAWEIFCCEWRDTADSSLGMGGIMRQSNEWSGGLRDHPLPIPEKKRIFLDTTIQTTIDSVIKNVFAYHKQQ
jgi:acetoin utilization protein AcuC